MRTGKNHRCSQLYENMYVLRGTRKVEYCFMHFLTKMLFLKELISLFLSFNHSFNGFKGETLVIYQIFRRKKKCFFEISFRQCQFRVI